jgi:aryl-alcohol dehydrogenase-like predicted oxidoreductase
VSLDHYVTLGRSGLRVSPLTLGTMTFGEDLGWGSPPEVAERIMQTYLDRGGNSIDTANIYTNGHSEHIIGEFLAARPGLRDRLVLGTKFFGNLHPGDPNGGGGGRKTIVASLEQSLRRLRTDYVDLYWLHNWDERAPIEETMRALDDLVTAGKVRYVGLSDLPAWVAARAQTIADFRGWTPAVALQLEYSLLERTAEGEVLPMARAFGLGALPWSPLKGGLLSGKYSRHDADSTRMNMIGGPGERDWPVIDAVTELAGELGVPPAAVALAWVQARPGVTSTLVGARTVEQLTTNLAALDVRLADGAAARLTAVSEPELAFPATYNRLAPALAFGGTSVDGRRDELPSFLTGAARY